MIEIIKKIVNDCELVLKEEFEHYYVENLIFNDFTSIQLFYEFYKPYLMKIFSRRGYSNQAETVVNSNIADVQDFEMVYCQIPIIEKNIFQYSREFKPQDAALYKVINIRCSRAKIEAPNLRFPIQIKLIDSINGYRIFENTLKEWEKFFVEYVLKKYFEPKKVESDAL